MKTGRLRKLAPLTGIITVGLWLLGIVLVTGSFGYTITADLAQENLIRDSQRVQAGALFAGCSAVFLIALAGSVFTSMRRPQSDDGLFAAIAYGGAIVSATAFAFAYGLLWVAANRAGRPEAVSADYAVIMNDLYSALLANVLSAGLAAFIGASGIASLQTHAFANWLGWVSVVFGAGLLTPSIGFLRACRPCGSLW